MRLLTNENISRTLVQSLRDAGHDVRSVKESLRGSTDIAVLSIAQTERRILITHDKDFGELAFRGGLPAECGVILLRLAGPDSIADNKRALAAIESRTDWAGFFSVVTDDRIRMRPLPNSATGP